MDLILSNRYNPVMIHSNIIIKNAKVFTANNDLPITSTRFDIALLRYPTGYDVSAMLDGRMTAGIEY